MVKFVWWFLLPYKRSTVNIDNLWFLEFWSRKNMRKSSRRALTCRKENLKNGFKQNWNLGTNNWQKRQDVKIKIKEFFVSWPIFFQIFLCKEMLNAVKCWSFERLRMVQMRKMSWGLWLITFINSEQIFKRHLGTLSRPLLLIRP